MERVEYSNDATLRAARDRYFELNGFGPNGGYDEKWVDFKLGKLPFPFPNTPARVRAVRYHDLHHVVTGYATNTIGEFEISAWEIAAGCKDYWAAWQLNLNGMAAGIFVAPRRTWRAFLRGRASRTLYDLGYEPLLDRTVGQMRRELGLEQAAQRGRAIDVAWFALATLFGFVLGLAVLVVLLTLLPLGLFWTVRAKRQRAALVTPTTRTK